MENKHLAIAEYYKLNREKLVMAAAKRIGSATEAEDLVQNLFLRLLTTDKMLNTVTLPALAYNMLCNMANDLWRRRKCAERYEKSVCADCDRDNGLTLYSAKQTEELLYRRMAKLDTRSCKILRMSMMEDRKVSEIAEEMQMKYKTVENKLYFARREIRSYMSAALSL